MDVCLVIMYFLIELFGLELVLNLVLVDLDDCLLVFFVRIWMEMSEFRYWVYMFDEDVWNLFCCLEGFLVDNYGIDNCFGCVFYLGVDWRESLSLFICNCFYIELNLL